MSLDNPKLYNAKSSIMDAYWHLLTLDNETQRLADYLNQKYKFFLKKALMKKHLIEKERFDKLMLAI